MLQVAINSFSYADKEILSDISFSLEKGEHLSVLGESGCGKSTLLHIIYGLLHLEKGTLYWEDKQLLGPNFNLVPGEDSMKLVAQEFKVMPFISVAENIATHLSRLDLKSDRKRVNELLEVVEMESFPETMVKNLSGGQKQRVALAKALAKEPQLLLLDEPFSNIDTFRKNTLRRKLFGYLKENNIACITATHDAEEALAFSDKILLLKDGKIEKLDTPENIYNALDNVYQAGFFGEVSIVPSGILSNEELILLPNQLQLSENETEFKVLIQKNYFKGKNYLIQTKFGDHLIFFENQNPIKLNIEVYLQLRNQ
ncbi:ABC transporter ATP-binding protein [Aureisphaera sp. CAU 1614]|uniref:ABC transporter ATP-binding protein n=1 Tax=Halomarinibacterium sedimenti TaxID=2857106 RepID=A0A9X1FN75_9FLAO|nr:ABC transporter ATP-binding protein [Halomarinibacterium sedimenti]MBW2937313.1 ABC transporter ATP-binding protein [Halomarinibacterium sedimenti]